MGRDMLTLVTRRSVAAQLLRDLARPAQRDRGPFCGRLVSDREIQRVLRRTRISTHRRHLRVRRAHHPAVWFPAHPRVCAPSVVGICARSLRGGAVPRASAGLCTIGGGDVRPVASRRCGSPRIRGQPHGDAAGTRVTAGTRDAADMRVTASRRVVRVRLRIRPIRASARCATAVRSPARRPSAQQHRRAGTAAWRGSRRAGEQGSWASFSATLVGAATRPLRGRPGARSARGPGAIAAASTSVGRGTPNRTRTAPVPLDEVPRCRHAQPRYSGSPIVAAPGVGRAHTARRCTDTA